MRSGRDPDGNSKALARRSGGGEPANPATSHEEGGLGDGGLVTTVKA